MVPATHGFYVGDAVTEEDIKVSFREWILKMTIPKKEAKAVPEKNSFPLKDNFTAKLYTSFRFVTPSLVTVAVQKNRLRIT